MKKKNAFIRKCEKYLEEKLCIGIQVYNNEILLLNTIITLDDINIYKEKIDLIYQTSNLFIDLNNISYDDTEDEYYTKEDNIYIGIWFL